jgi:hypothetical protein
MTTYSGDVGPSLLYNEEEINPSLGLMDVPVWDEGWDSGLSLSGSHTSTQPVAEFPNAFDGDIAENYAFLHWYNRIHMQYNYLNLGNVVGDQVITFWIFNSFFTSKELAEVTETNVSGIVLVQPDTPPFNFAPFQEYSYSLQVDANGSPSIDALYEFDFTGYGILTLEIRGIRVVGWRWEPNWASEIRERLRWFSESSESYSGVPQLTQLAEYPTQQWEFLVDVDKRALRSLENALYKWTGRNWAVPVWPDVHSLEDELPAGSGSVLLDTTTRSYETNGMAMFIFGEYYETMEIDSLTSSSITFKQPSARTWPVGTRVYPVFFGKLVNGASLARYLRNYGYGTIIFDGVVDRPYTPATETNYRGYPVLTRMPEWNTDPIASYQDLLQIVDGEWGPNIYEKHSEIPRVFYSWNWQSFGRDEIDALRKFLYARRGRVRAVWVPTYAEDLVLTLTVAPTGTTLEVEFARLLQFLDPESVHRRDIRIELVNGSVFYRRIIDISSVDEDHENLSMDSPLGQTVTPDDIARISWMQLLRLDTDTVELAWASPQVVSTQLPFRGYNDDV